ncbi:hypothetical protein BDZ91DRAFT_787035 [Kalaharituber pfeilii]|nr:hypothetical protein BDZ91DRAFT_787035 [Kalaharituber pfeilii]
MSAPIPNSTPWELGIAYILHLWPALTFTVTSNWSGSNSADNGISLNASEEPDKSYVEEMLFQIMEDELDVVVEDDSAARVASQILRFRTELREGKTAHLEALCIRFEQQAKKSVAISSAQNGQDEDDDDDGEGGGANEEMKDAGAVPFPAPCPSQ